ncbi:hypothetical protein FEM48_Zijuj12G0093000 [Ziziphus jujuba var. spinosa]|nr:hypothetical protein FEM48_Zijuj12G0093000 [Ziziphus jujuba var. spinosa]
MFPSCGLLNINAQPSVHVIHQRLQELKQNGVLSQTTSSSSTSSSSDSKQLEAVQITTQLENPSEKEKDMEISSDKMVKDQDQDQEKPQIDLNEFLQQLGVLKGGREAEEGSCYAVPESPFKELNDHELGDFTEQSFDWDTLMEMQGIHADDDQAAEANNSTFQAYDVNEELGFPNSIWNF